MPAKILLLLIAFVFSLPAIKGLSEDSSERESWEHRKLAMVPEIILLFHQPDEYFSHLNSYLSDHFGFMLPLNKLHRKISFYVFKTTPSPNISIGLDGYVFLNSHDPKGLNHVFEGTCVAAHDHAHTEKIKLNIVNVSNYYSKKGYRFVAATVPTKPVVYPEKLPPSVPSKYRESCAAYDTPDNGLLNLAGEAELQNVIFYYPFAAFRAKREQAHFFPKENFHFNGLSAHVFAKGLLSQLGFMLPNSYDSAASLVRHQTDLTGPIGFTRYTNIWQFPYSNFKVHTRMHQPALVKNYYQRVEDFRTLTTAEALSDKKALVISDSFGAYAIYHLAPAYKELVHVDINHLQSHERAAFYSEAIAKIDPDDVIFLFHDGGVLGNRYKDIEEAVR